MLSPAQVIRFLTHEYELVRAHAAQYLREGHDLSPATADDFWAAIDRFGFDLPFQSVLKAARHVPQTDRSITKTLEAMSQWDADDEKTFDYLSACLRWIDVPLLRRRWDEIRNHPEVEPDVREHLEQRIEIASADPEQIWQELEARSKLLDEDNDAPLREDEAERWIEGLARHPVYVERAFTALNGPPAGHWRELSYLNLVGKARYAPAVDVLVSRLLDEESDYIPQRAADALSAIGSVEVISAIEHEYPRHDACFHNTASEVLGRIKRPESEQALLRLFATETDIENRTFLAGALTRLCPNDTPVLDALRQMVERDDFDSLAFDLREELVAVSIMAGYAFEDLSAMKTQVDVARAKLAQRVQEMEGYDWDPGDDEEADDDEEDELELSYGTWRDDAPSATLMDVPELQEPLRPIRRQEPKIGRNDPCPCGSGKKYKKCCGANV